MTPLPTRQRTLRGLLRRSALFLAATVLLVVAFDAPPVESQPAIADPGAAMHRPVATGDAATSQTLILARIDAGGEGIIGFDLLRQTKLYRKPPPIFPEQLTPLDGGKVRINGFMTPYDDLNTMKVFMLMPSPTGCFFCAPPSPREVVLIRQAPGADAYPFIYEPIQVEGTLSLWKPGATDEGHKMFLYILNDAKVGLLERVK